MPVTAPMLMARAAQAYDVLVLNATIAATGLD